VEQRLLVTGASGRVGSLIRHHLRRPGRELRLLDLTPPPGLDADAETFLAGSVTDPEAMAAACKEVDLVVHLGGHASERTWNDIVDTNIHGTYVVLEAARRHEVRRVLLASDAGPPGPPDPDIRLGGSWGGPGWEVGRPW